MNQRFQIEELAIQDHSGVVFRAFDTETQQKVAVRRFFPFGPDGGGLNEDEQAAYNIAVGRLSKITDPSLRRIITGGCDPVDGMPFIATEWVEGKSILDFVSQHPLAPESAAQVVDKAMEACEKLSEALDEEAIWIETQLKTIVVGAEGSGRDITFWISPSKWLGGNESQRGLDSILRLANDLTGWRTLASNQLPPGGFTNWLNWLRAHTATASLREARERLTASMSGQAPAANRATVRPAPTRTAKVVLKKKKSRMPATVIGVLILAAIGGGGWWAVQHHAKTLEKTNSAKFEVPAATTAMAKAEAPKPAAAAKAEEKEEAKSVAKADEPEPPEIERSLDEASRRAQELTAQAKETSEKVEAETTRVKEEVTKRDGVFTPADHDLLLAQEGKQVALEGTFEQIDYSKSRKTMYVMFSKSAGARDPRGGIMVGSAPPDLTESALGALIGKKIRLRGQVQVDRVGSGPGRPVIMIDSRKAIEALE